MKNQFALRGVVSRVALSFSAAVALVNSPGIAQPVLVSPAPVPSWPTPAMAPAGAPNIVLIMLDDVGFADTATFGGPAATPVLDRLASEGLRYNRFHTTSICSPTRASLLTGRNPHQVGQGTVGEIGYPGYNGIWPKDTVSVAEVLRRGGYGTAVIGKWHNTPFREISPTGPFDRWPTSLGFEYFYGNMLGAASQWEPILWRNTQMVEQPKSRAQGYHFTSDIVDESIRWIGTQKSLAPDKPYFLYFAPLAGHMPHHVPQEWIDRYKGRFNQGWDRLREEIFTRQKRLDVIPQDAKLTPRPAELPAWDSLTPKQRQVFSRQMEAYAGFLSHTDHEIGRLLAAIRAAPGGDNTIVIYIVGDNGSAGEIDVAQAEQMAAIMPDGKTSMYTAGWAWAGSTPFQWSKGLASHFGGTRNPMIVSWPGRTKNGGVARNQFTHVNDVAATLYEISGITMPAVVDGVRQKPLEGTSFAYTFTNARAPSRHRTQYFEVWGNRAIYSDGWIASARHGVPWRMKGSDQPLEPQSAFAADRWELYDLDRDFSQATDLAATQPERLQRMKALFDREARRNAVYPLISNNMYGAYPPVSKPQEFRYRDGMPSFLALAGPNFGGKSFQLNADIDVANGTEGVIFSHGGALSLYMKSGLLQLQGIPMPGTKILTSGTPLAPGRHRITLRFEVDPGSKAGAYMPSLGSATLAIDGKTVDEGRIAVLYSSMGEVDIGRDTASPASRFYTAPFPFTGGIADVRLRVEP